MGNSPGGEEPLDEEAQPPERDTEGDRESPFSTETVEFMAALPNQLAAVVLRGLPARGHRVRLDVTAAFLTRLESAVYALAGVMRGSESGSRGPLKRVDLGGLALAEVTWGSSAVFHFVLAEEEQTALEPSGEVRTLTEQATAALADLLEMSAAGNERQLYQASRDLGPRAVANFGRLLEVFIENEVSTLWRLRDEEKAIDLTATRAIRAQAALKREARIEAAEFTVSGLLYEAHARRQGFELLVAEGYDAPTIRGKYAPGLRNEIRDAWDRHVDVQIRVVRKYLERQIEPVDTEVTLIDVLRIEQE